MTDAQIAAQNDRILTQHTEDWLRGDLRPRYAVQRVADLYWLAGGDRWSVRAFPARWFDSHEEATFAGVRDISEPVHTWLARLIPKEAY